MSEGKFSLQFEQGFEDAVLAVAQQDQLRGTPAGDLAAQFAADRAAGAGDQHHLAAQGAADQFFVESGPVRGAAGR